MYVNSFEERITKPVPVLFELLKTHTIVSYRIIMQFYKRRLIREYTTKTNELNIVQANPMHGVFALR